MARSVLLSVKLSFQVSLSAPVPSAEEIDFVIEVLERIGAPALDKVEKLLESAGHWNNVARNDFCRYALIHMWARRRD